MGGAPSGATLQGGVLSGHGTVAGNLTTNGGQVAPGASAGLLTVDGGCTQTQDGHLAVEIGGTQPAQFDRLHVTGSVVLGGVLDLSAIDGFQLQPGDSFEIITGASVQGQFSTVTGACLNGGNLCLNVVYQATSVRLETGGPSGIGEVAADLPNELRFFATRLPGGVTELHVDLTEPSELDLRVYNVVGRELAALVRDSKPAGRFTYSWNGASNDGRLVGSGIYFARLTARSQSTVAQKTVRILATR